MTTANHPENQNPNGLHDLVQIINKPCETDTYVSRETFKAEPRQEGTREHIEALLMGLTGTSLSGTIKAVNRLWRGSYKISVRAVAEYNEVQIRLYVDRITQPIASAFIDRGQTKDDHLNAAEDVRSTVRAYLCR